MLLVSSAADSSAAPDQGVQIIEPGVAASYGVLRRPAAPRDLLSDSRFTNTTEDAAGANRRLARRVDDGNGRLAMWLVPGQGSVCMALRLDQIAGDSGGTCTALADGRSDLLLTLGGGAEGGPGLQPHEVIVAGIVPDGVSQVQLTLRSGERQSLEVVDNGFSANVDSATQSVSYTTAAGEPVVRPAPSYEG